MLIKFPLKKFFKLFWTKQPLYVYSKVEDEVLLTMKYYPLPEPVEYIDLVEEVGKRYYKKYIKDKEYDPEYSPLNWYTRKAIDKLLIEDFISYDKEYEMYLDIEPKGFIIMEQGGFHKFYQKEVPDEFIELMKKFKVILGVINLIFLILGYLIALLISDLTS